MVDSIKPFERPERNEVVIRVGISTILGVKPSQRLLFLRASNAGYFRETVSFRLVYCQFSMNCKETIFSNITIVKSMHFMFVSDI